MIVVENKTSETPAQLKDESFQDLEADYKETNTNGHNVNKLRVVELEEFLSLELPPRDLIVSPWLPSAGLCMIFATRGIGKTFVALNIAYMVASGGEFLNWRAEKPRSVLFIDGEMSCVALQERLAEINLMYGHKGLPKKLRFVTPDLQSFGMPDLGTQDGQLQINELITEDTELIIIDNLSSLIRSGRENESESWLPIQTWALGLRAKGKSVLFIHHAGKGGAQRGSSKKEDVLDTVISLSRPDGYTQDKGASFIVNFEKSRGFYGEDAKSFEANFTTNQFGKPCWVMRSLEDSTYDKVVTLLNEGLSQTEIAGELSIHKSNVSRYTKRAKNGGLLTNKGVLQ